MTTKVVRYCFIILFTTNVFSGCTEPFAIEDHVYENALVVETTITNELKHQEVKLSRVIQLTDSIDVYEKNAQVWIETSNKETYHFLESEDGIYLSNDAFKAVPNVAYKLFITTSDTKQYESKKEYLTPEAEIANLYAEKEIVHGELGVQVYIDSNEDVGDAKYFRYEFEETYKIVTPYIVDYDIEITNVNTTPATISFDRIITPRVENKHICYKTDFQNKIIQTSFIHSQNNQTEVPIHFISEDNYIIREGYSILVRQFIQSFDSYNYYDVLNRLGNVESLLVENQPGFVRSNISSLTNENEKVLGFFDMSSVSEKRIFFNYYDIGLQKPEFPFWCETQTWDYNDTLGPSIDFDPHERSMILHLLYNEDPPWELLDMPFGDSIPIYTFLRPICSNCTSIATNSKPEFWED